MKVTIDGEQKFPLGLTLYHLCWKINFNGVMISPTEVFNDTCQMSAKTIIIFENIQFKKLSISMNMYFHAILAKADIRKNKRKKNRQKQIFQKHL